jgi:hypothetical protein
MSNDGLAKEGEKVGIIVSSRIMSNEWINGEIQNQLKVIGSDVLASSPY